MQDKNVFIIKNHKICENRAVFYSIKNHLKVLYQKMDFIIFIKHKSKFILIFLRCQTNEGYFPFYFDFNFFILNLISLILLCLHIELHFSNWVLECCFGFILWCFCIHFLLLLFSLDILLLITTKHRFS